MEQREKRWRCSAAACLQNRVREPYRDMLCYVRGRHVAENEVCVDRKAEGVTTYPLLERARYTSCQRCVETLSPPHCFRTS